MSIALGCNPLVQVAKIYLVDKSSRRKTSCAIAKAISTALIVTAEPDAPLLAQKEPVDHVGESCKGGKLDEGQQPWCALPGNMDFELAPEDGAAQINNFALGGEIIPEGRGNHGNT